MTRITSDPTRKGDGKRMTQFAPAKCTRTATLLLGRSRWTWSSKSTTLPQGFPKSELYGLVSQLRRAAVSVPSNIAEGQSRSSTRDFRQFLCVSRGSNSELQTQLEISLRLGFIGSDECRILMSQAAEVGKMLNSLITRLSEKIGVTNH